ncbi:hypothetical protein [Curtobacterium sp. MCJR17_043]|uniref:hypothetical protein n=1 Tax=Curtobacterium sp. MCJR17_043 TaxID=2175660 RepID=UPI0024DFE91E|nr:hypothetical protein [Curtobacterium sp. MCJR17_043]WIB34952.1 hypothetical protein DEJ15_10515 [Curtobacterium sp. MCJR17_043]
MFDERTAPLDEPVTTESAFTEAQRASHEFLGTYAARRDELDARRDALTREEYPLLDRERTLRQERRSLEHRQGAMPLPMHEARVAMARAAGLDPADVPFVAELLDVLPAEEQWRTAIESVLAPVARTLLVDEDRLDDFSAAIDGLRLPVRVQFEGVPLGPHLDLPGDRAMVSGKLAIKASPFSTWVRERIESDRIDARCVADAAELGGGGRRVTVSGQLRDGRRGAHGDRRQANVIGFTNESRVRAVETELAEIAADLTALEARRTDVAQDLAALDVLRAAHQHRVDVTWDAVDVAGADAALARLEEERHALLAADDGLRTLRESVARLRAALDEAADRRSAARLGVKRLEERHAVLVDGQDAAAEILERFADAPDRLPDEQQERLLAEAFDEVGAPRRGGRVRRRDQTSPPSPRGATRTGARRRRDGVGGAHHDVRAVPGRLAGPEPGDRGGLVPGLPRDPRPDRRHGPPRPAERVAPSAVTVERRGPRPALRRVRPRRRGDRGAARTRERDPPRPAVRGEPRPAEDRHPPRHPRGRDAVPQGAPRAVGLGRRRTDRRRARDPLPATAAVHGRHPA